jgi:hypothetical protein
MAPNTTYAAALLSACRLLSRWVLQADRSAVAYVVLWAIILVRARGTRNQLQLNKGHYIGW